MKCENRWLAWVLEESAGSTARLPWDRRSRLARSRAA
jgi:hypothetical protein